MHIIQEVAFGNWKGQFPIVINEPHVRSIEGTSLILFTGWIFKL